MCNYNLNFFFPDLIEFSKNGTNSTMPVTGQGKNESHVKHSFWIFPFSSLTVAVSPSVYQSPLLFLRISLANIPSGNSVADLGVISSNVFVNFFLWHWEFKMSISHAKWRWKSMVTTIISEWFAYERVLIRCFPEKMNAKSPFSVLVIVIECV